jgi:hypothetical protein
MNLRQVKLVDRLTVHTRRAGGVLDRAALPLLLISGIVLIHTAPKTQLRVGV